MKTKLIRPLSAVLGLNVFLTACQPDQVSSKGFGTAANTAANAEEVSTDFSVVANGMNGDKFGDFLIRATLAYATKHPEYVQFVCRSENLVATQTVDTNGNVTDVHFSDPSVKAVIIGPIDDPHDRDINGFYGTNGTNAPLERETTANFLILEQVFQDTKLKDRLIEAAQWYSVGNPAFMDAICTQINATPQWIADKDGNKIGMRFIRTTALKTNAETILGNQP